MIFLLGCISPSAEPQTLSRDIKDTQIESFLLECSSDQEYEIWTLEVSTVGWSSGGFLWMAEEDTSNDTANNDTAEDPYIHSERHPFYSVGAQLDGSADRLKLTLMAVSDWRDAAPGSTTRWLCADEERLTFWIEVLNSDGTAIADCTSWGIEGEPCL